MVRSARRRFNLVSSVVSHGYGNGPVAALIAILLGDTATSKHVIRIFEAKTFVHGLGLLVVTPFRIAYIYIYICILLPANWKTLWPYQQMLDDNGWGLMFEPSFLSPCSKRPMPPNKRFQIFPPLPLLPPRRFSHPRR